MIEIKIPTMDVNELSCEVTDLMFNNGDKVEKGDATLTLETTKASEDIVSLESGIIKYLIEEGDKIEFGKVACYIFKNIKEYEEYNKELSILEKKTDLISGNFKLTKKAEKYVIKHNIDLDKFIEVFTEKKIIKLDDIKKINQTKTESNKIKTPLMNNRKRIVIIGGGSSGEVVADILMDYPEYEIVGFVDDNPRDGFSFYGKKIIFENVKEFPLDFDKSLYDAVIFSFSGDLESKKDIITIYNNKNIQFINAIDKTVKIGRNVKLGVGNVIGANTYIGTSTILGDNNWIAASVNIDHHNLIGDYNLFGPNFTSPGIVQIGNLNKFGANSSLSNYISIGDNNTIMNNISVYKNISNKEILK